MVLRTYLVYNTVVRLCQFFCCGRKVNFVGIPYSHDRFSKISRTLFDFLNNTYWVSFFVRNNSLIFRTGVSCFSVTLFYSTLLTPFLALTDRQTDRQRNEYTCFAWAGGTFFPVVLLFQFFVLAGNRFWFYILLMYLEYHTVVVLC